MYVIANEVVPPAITRDLAKLHLRVTHGLEDLLIDSYILAATQFVESFTGLRFVERDVTLQAPLWDGRWRLPKGTKTLISAKFEDFEVQDGRLLAGFLRFDAGLCIAGPCEIALRVGCAASAEALPAKYRGALLAAVAHLYVNREGQDWPAGIYVMMRTLSGVRL